ncbi:lecithin retinol acyltransferase family protein, partial [Avibacterium paragallinarum]
HSGIYVGNNSVVHLNKHGEIKKVSLSDFIKGTSAITIYVSCCNGKAIGNKKVGNFALSQIGKRTKYNVLLRNCHQFSSSCITGNLDNNDRLLSLLKITARKKLGVNEWRALEQ